jgi:AcrR family transcriptional regulator
MAWNTEQTKSRLLDAAGDEFAELGYSGARIDRIAARAGVNKERIYPYFGNKSGLFEAVISRQMEWGLDEIPLTGEGAEAVARFAGDYFDASVSNPRLARLTAWEGLERSEPVGVDERTTRAALKSAAIEKAVPGLDRESAQDILLTIVSLSHGWTAGRNVGRTITEDPDDNARRRTHIFAAVQAMTVALARLPRPRSLPDRSLSEN